MTTDELFVLKPRLEEEAKAAKRLNRIQRMHHLYGQTPGEKCGDCTQFERREFAGTYFKCLLYGVSRGPATDWRVRYPACGKFARAGA